VKSCILGSSRAITLRPLSMQINFVHRLTTFVALGVWPGSIIPKEQRCDKNFGPRSRRCMMLGYVHDTTHIWRLWDFETNTGHLHGRPFHWSDVEWEEDANAFPFVAAGSTAGDSEPEELVFPDEYYDDPPPSQPASLDLPGAETPCHRDTASPHVESPPLPAPCHRDTASPHVDQCVAYALIISCNLQLLLTLLIVCRVAKPCRVAKL
jgi:hypothetical protein